MSDYKTRILIWTKCGGQCAICKRNLVREDTLTDDPSFVGDIAHIVGKEKKSARYESPLTAQQRDLSTNLVLLCKEHHKLVDDDEIKYTIEHLTEIKRSHEQSINDALSVSDKQKQQSTEIYAGYIQEWAEGADLDNWQPWTSFMMGSDLPRMSKDNADRLQHLRDWLFNRVWPVHFPELQLSLENFRRVLADLLETFHEHSTEQNDWLWTQKFYKSFDYHPVHTIRAERKYDYHVDLVFDLTLELTRAANFVCDTIRGCIDPSFRIHEGLVIAESGPYMDLKYRKHRVQYQANELQASNYPYPGLNKFLFCRKDRDLNFGEGEWNDN